MEHLDPVPTTLRIVIEKHVPFIAGLLEPYARVTYLDTDEITPEAVRDANALIIRSRTVCDSSLLGSSRCSLIVTATVGTDHIDLDWCAKRGIAVVNAPGCNAPAVAQYVMSSIISLSNRPLEQYTLGIVGVGNVGRIVHRWARALGMEVLICDPPRQMAEGSSGWSTLEDIAARADIITFHTPLVPAGQPNHTFHLADKQFFDSCRRAPIIINAARGAVIDTPALISALESATVSAAVIDCWENEPRISTRLLDLAAIATTHIAGWSHEGKIRASQMALDALTSFFFLPRVTIPLAPVPAPATTVSPMGLLNSFNPLPLTVNLKNNPQLFESIRNSYKYRNEPPEENPPC